MKPTPIAYGVMLSLLLTSCKAGEDFVLPDIKVQSDWQETKAASKAPLDENALQQWWQSLNDTTLNQLVGEALSSNKDVAIAMANLERARALRNVVAADLYPQVNAGGSASREGLSRAKAGGEKERDSFDAGLDASWELDIFGRTRRNIEAAEADINVAEATRDEVQLMMVAELVRNYYTVRGYQKRIAITERNIRLLGELQQLAQAQLDGGTVTELDVARARGEKETIAATLPGLEAEKTTAIYRLSVLTGQEPQAQQTTMETTKPLPMPADQVPVGLRTDILKRRPDMRIAQAELARSVALEGVAEADLFPSLSLTGALGTGAAFFSDLFTTGGVRYLIGAALDWSVFDGGSVRARIDASKADTKASLLNYEQQVLLALEDAEGSLMRYGKEWQTYRSLQTARASRQQAFDIARLRYEAGEESFIVILDAERALVSLDDSLVQSETRILTGLTQVYKALGGGWQQPTTVNPKTTP